MRRLLFLPLAAALGIVLWGCGGQASPPPKSPTSLQPAPPVDASALFTQDCSPCHGADRQGVVGPALTAAALQSRGRTDQYITDTITNGRGGMPAWKDKLTPVQIDALLRFLRT